MTTAKKISILSLLFLILLSGCHTFWYGKDSPDAKAWEEYQKQQRQQ